jgi:RHS repeat-associated protein
VDKDADGELSPGDTDVTEYAWDYGNRLVQVVDRGIVGGAATQIVEHTYDAFNRWIGTSVDPDGDGPAAAGQTYFVYDGTQIVLQFDGPQAADLSRRYLWGPAVDQVLADEQIGGEVLWPLGDHLGTVRDLIDSSGNVENHRTYDAFGRIASETNPAVDHLFAFTGRPLDESTGLQNNLHRWYDAAVGRWVSEDPVGFEAGDANLGRYVINRPTTLVDPDGQALKRQWIYFSDGWSFGVDRGPEIRGGFEIHVYHKGVERAKVTGFGGFCETHSGKRLMSPSEFKKAHPDVARRLRVTLRQSAKGAARAEWRRNRILSGRASRVAGVLAIFSLGTASYAGLDAVVKNPNFRNLVRSLERGDFQGAEVFADKIYLELLGGKHANEHWALSWKAIWDEVKIRGLRERAVFAKELAARDKAQCSK